VTRERWLWPIRILTVLIGLGVLASGIGSVIEVFGTRRHTQTTLITAPVHTLQLSDHSGDVVIHTGPANGGIRVQAKMTDVVSTAGHSETVTAGVLKIVDTCHSRGWLLNTCAVDFDIQLPPGIAVQASSGSGNVSVRGATRPVWSKTGSGDIHLLQISGPITASTGSGDITGAELSGRALQGKTGSGDISLKFIADPTTVKAKTGSGDVIIRVPDDRAGYLIGGNTGSGDRTVKVPKQPNLGRVITANTGSGDVFIARTGTD
jgi:hypothetical protein